jgi:hypothetical protein
VTSPDIGDYARNAAVTRAQALHPNVWAAGLGLLRTSVSGEQTSGRFNPAYGMTPPVEDGVNAAAYPAEARGRVFGT